MTTFTPEDYVFPESLDEVSAILREHGDSARIIAGGTTIHELGYHKGLGQVRQLLDITRLPLSYIHDEDGAVRVGTTTTFTDLLRFAESRAPQQLAVLSDTIRAIRPMQVRNVGTIGGSICSSLPFFDLPAALVVLDAHVSTLRAGEERTTPLETFFWDFFLTDLRYSEVLAEVQLRLPGPAASGAFQKFETNSVDWALVSIAVQLENDGDRFKDVRIALGGGVGRKVTRAAHVEEALEGRPIRQDAILAAVELVDDDVTTFNDFRASSKFRTHLLKVYIRRCINTALSRIP